MNFLWYFKSSVDTITLGFFLAEGEFAHLWPQEVKDLDFITQKDL